MVALVHETLGQTVPHDLSRPLLYAAHDAYEDGDMLRAACFCREAIAMHVKALCEYHGCTPKKPKRPKPWQYLRALKREDHICSCMYSWMLESLGFCNRAAHLERMRPGLIECAISLTATLIDDSPWAYADLRGGVV